MPLSIAYHQLLCLPSKENQKKVTLEHMTKKEKKPKKYTLLIIVFIFTSCITVEKEGAAPQQNPNEAVFPAKYQDWVPPMLLSLHKSTKC